jgi:IMP dehydrogenase
MIIAELLKKCGDFVYTASENLTVAEAVREMALKNTSVLIVVEKDIPVGIFTDRDVFRCCRLHQNESFSEFKIADAMTRNIVSACPEDDTGDALNKMLQLKVHHLPVVDAQKVTGMINIVDLVREHVDLLNGEIHFLNDYIARLQEAAHD